MDDRKLDKNIMVHLVPIFTTSSATCNFFKDRWGGDRG